MSLKSNEYNEGLIYTDVEGCIDCSKCIHECPVLTANVSVTDTDGKYAVCVDEEECVLCGTCIDTCAHNVRCFKDDCDEFFSELKQGKEFSVLIAPAFYTNYPEQYKNVLGYLKSVGVKNIYSVSFGADIAIWGYINYINTNDAKGLVAQPCPSIVSLIEKHLPKLLPNVIPIQSPMMCVAIYLKRYLGVKEDLVFLSPCIAKKVEIQSKRGLGLIRHNVTFKKLMTHIEQQGINLDDYHGEEEKLNYGMGSLLPKPGGLSENISYYIGPEAAVIQVEGERRVYEYLENFATLVDKQDAVLPQIVDAINCQKGCNLGTGTDVRHVDENSALMETIALRKEKYYSMQGDGQKVLYNPADRLAKLNEIFKDLKLEDFMCEYEDSQNAYTVTDDVIEAVLSEALHKFTDHDRHRDCSACGYKTCRQMAVAIVLGINHRNNCIYYMRDSVQNAEERLRNIIDGMPLVANLRDRNHNVVECNYEAVKLFGLKNKQEYIEKFDELMPPLQPDGKQTKTEMDTLVGQALVTGSAHSRLVFRNMSGELIPCEVSLIRIVWRDDYHIATFITDMREHYKNQENAYNMEQRLNAMLDASPLLCAIFDENYNPVEVNEEAVRLLNLTDKQEYVENFVDMLPEVQPCGTPSREKAVTELSRTFRERSSYIAEWMYKTSDGEPVPTEVFLECMQLEGKNVVMTYARDLRPVKHAIQLALEANAAFKTFLEASPILMEVWDEDYNLIDCNRRTLEHFGVKHLEEYIERYDEFQPAFQYCKTPTKKKNIELLEEAFANGQAHSEFLHVSENGEFLPVEQHLVRLSRQGENVVVCYKHDLRHVKYVVEKLHEEKARRESIEEESRTKTRFLAQMSHEIRTPLNSVIGVAEMQLMNEDLLVETRDAFQRIRESSSLLLNIINDILDHSKVAAGKMEIVHERYYSTNLIIDTVRLHSVYIGSKSIKLELDIDERLPISMIGDELRIKQVVNNILTNAFKYTDEGVIKFSVGVDDAEQDDDYVTLVISVSDTGIGMTREQLDGLFKEFVRYDTDTHRNSKIEGTGLGMHITYMLTKLMQGELTVESELGKGTVFTVRLPQKMSSPQILGKDMAAELRSIEHIQKYSNKSSVFVREPMPYGKVLVVDDVESNLYVAKGLLQAYKLSVDTVESGYQAIDKIDSGEIYDIIFMDHMMPGLNGIETTEIIRSKGYNHPIVALTANATRGQDKFFEGLDLGFSAFISKPIDIVQLNNCLTRLIRDKQTPEVIEAANKEYGGLFDGGSVERHLPMESVLRDAQKTLLILEPMLGQDELSKEALEMYTIQVHGMKTVLSNVGNEELSKVAHTLEKAGEKTDFDTIKTLTPSFVESLREIAEELSLKLGQEPDEADDEDMEFLRSQLLIIEQACEDFDINEADDALYELEQNPSSKQTKELLREIKGCLLRGDFEGAAEIIRQYVGA